MAGKQLRPKKLQHKLNSNSQIVILFSGKIVSRAPFSPSGSRQEVNSTLVSEIEETIKSREKHYSLVLYILVDDSWLE